MQLNEFFVTNINTIYGQAGTTWLNELSRHLKELEDEWKFTFINPLPELSFNFVGLVKMNKTGESAILKMAPPRASLISEIRWLQSFKKSVPQIYAADEKRQVYLMEHLRPGVSLKSIVKNGDDDRATKIICETIRNLQTQQPIAHSFQHLSELSKSLKILKGRYDKKLLSQAEDWFRDLTQDKTHDVLLHGDLHHDNILSSGSDWKAIDPHGYIGDPVAEVGTMIRNPFDCFPNHKPIAKVIERRLQLMADELPFDAHKIKAWAFCMTVLSGAWTAEDFPKATELEEEVASAINKVKI